MSFAHLNLAADFTPVIAKQAYDAEACLCRYIVFFFYKMRAVRKHTDCKWVILYIERWLKALAQLEDGSLIHRDKGTPQ